VLREIGARLFRAKFDRPKNSDFWQNTKYPYLLLRISNSNTKAGLETLGIQLLCVHLLILAS
jgi:hypothetical protein